jgi:hypothetical protein
MRRVVRNLLPARLFSSGIALAEIFENFFLEKLNAEVDTIPRSAREEK